MLPRDGHVHTEWSWDAPHGSMERACARAVNLGVPAIAFTDHADFVTWRVSDDVAAFLHDLDATVSDGVFTPARLDLDGYFDCVQRCRHQFPDLTIQSGVELGEPHWYTAEATATLDAGRFDLVVAAVHSLAGGDGGFVEVSDAYLERPPHEVVRDYLAEINRLIAQWDRFDALAHIDYAARSWPASERAYRTRDFEDDYRSALNSLARTGRALEVNTRLPLDPLIVTWWRQEGGTSVTFGSDVHDAHFIAQGLDMAAAMVAEQGFRPGSEHGGFWTVG